MFIGRDLELRKLRDLFKKDSANLVVVKGRRRIGKSKLIQEFGKEFARSLEFSGLAPDEGVTAVRSII